MDYIEVTKNKRKRRVALAIMALCILIAPVSIIIWPLSRETFSTTFPFLYIGFVLGVFSSFGSFIGYLQVSNDEVLARDRQACRGFNANYGLNFSWSDFISLRYPVLHPQHSFVQYGSTMLVRRSGDSYSRQEIFLLWDQGQMVLASSENGELKRLETAKAQNNPI